MITSGVRDVGVPPATTRDVGILPAIKLNA